MGYEACLPVVEFLEMISDVDAGMFWIPCELTALHVALQLIETYRRSLSYHQLRELDLAYHDARQTTTRLDATRRMRQPAGQNDLHFDGCPSRVLVGRGFTGVGPYCDHHRVG